MSPMMFHFPFERLHESSYIGLSKSNGSSYLFAKKDCHLDPFGGTSHFQKHRCIHDHHYSLVASRFPYSEIHIVPPFPDKAISLLMVNTPMNILMIAGWYLGYYRWWFPTIWWFIPLYQWGSWPLIANSETTWGYWPLSYFWLTNQYIPFL